jgi:hypothetical protein
LGKAAKEMSQRLAVLISALTTIILSSCCPGLSTDANKIPQDNFPIQNYEESVQRKET